MYDYLLYIHLPLYVDSIFYYLPDDMTIIFWIYQICLEMSNMQWQKDININTESALPLEKMHHVKELTVLHLWVLSKES